MVAPMTATNRPRIRVGARLRDRDGRLGHVVATFNHGGPHWVIAVWGRHKRRWFFYVENEYAFEYKLWTVEGKR